MPRSRRPSTISIHALREEGDLAAAAPERRTAISIHALREEGDITSLLIFRPSQANFYPRPPRGGRPTSVRYSVDSWEISIHALREEGDSLMSAHLLDLGQFLSTPSARRATPFRFRKRRRARYFYPRPPRGGRLRLARPFFFISRFLSTPSARRATQQLQKERVAGQISIHALREEGDALYTAFTQCRFQFLSTPSARRATTMAMTCRSKEVYFYPRPPRGGRLQPDAAHGCAPEISIHALREEGDAGEALRVGGVVISIHALREEGDTLPTGFLTIIIYFYPRPPRGGRPGAH